jgi:hypothetical protein
LLLQTRDSGGGGKEREKESVRNTQAKKRLVYKKMG